MNISTIIFWIFIAGEMEMEKKIHVVIQRSNVVCSLVLSLLFPAPDCYINLLYVLNMQYTVVYMVCTELTID